MSPAGRWPKAIPQFLTLCNPDLPAIVRAGFYCALGGGHAVLDHLRCAGEEAVAMRIVGRPQDLVRSDILGEHPEAALDRLERDPAIAPEELARPGLETGIVKALIVEMAVHAVEPGCHPAAARF